MGAYPTGNELTVTVTDAAIREYWNSEALNGAYSEATIAKKENVIHEFSDGKKFGDVYHFIETAAFTTNAVGADGAVTNQSITHTNRQVSINLWRDVSVTLPDRSNIQSALEYGNWFSKNAGGAIAEYWDEQLFGLHTDIQAANQLGSTTSPEPMSDDLVLEANIVLDDAKVKQNDRAWFFAPRAKYTLLKMDKFVDVMKTGLSKGAQLTGLLGELYGSNVFMSALVVNTGTPAVRKNLYMHRTCMAMVMERELNIEKLARVSKADTWSGDTLGGRAVTRANWGVVINTAA